MLIPFHFPFFSLITAASEGGSAHLPVWICSPEAGGKRLKIATGSVRITSDPPTLFS